MVFGLGCLVLGLVLLCVDEPWYRRDIAPENQPSKGSRLSRVLGLWQVKHHAGYFLSPGEAYRRLLYVLLKPIMLPIMIY